MADATAAGGGIDASPSRLTRPTRLTRLTRPIRG